MKLHPIIENQLAWIKMRPDWKDACEPLPLTIVHNAREVFDTLVAQLQEKHCQILRFMPYDQFLCTDYWRIVRNMKLWKHRVCESCGAGRIFQVHHTTYEHHGYEHLHLEDLIVLCKECHGFLHTNLRARMEMEKLTRE